MAEKIFADGLIVKSPREGAPEFVLGSLSFKVEEFKAFLDKHSNNGWVNVDLLMGKSGKPYASLNQYKPEKREEERVEPDTNDPSQFPAEGSDLLPF